VHVVCNNAGTGTGGPLELTTPGDCDWIIGVDLMGTIYGCQTFLPHIKAHGEGGHIVSTASVTGLFPVPGRAVHAAAKAGVIALSQTLAAELAGTSIGVSVLVPAFMRTRIAEREHTIEIARSVLESGPRLRRRVRTNSQPLFVPAWIRTKSPRCTALEKTNCLSFHTRNGEAHWNSISSEY
jgi:NAD(P)-dependent dehydrogenase (short-subunit alcohol dehydrogenase family)